MYWIPLAMLTGLGARHLQRASAWALGLCAVAFWVFFATLSGGMDSEVWAIAVAIAAGMLAVIVFAVPRTRRLGSREPLTPSSRSKSPSATPVDSELFGGPGVSVGANGDEVGPIGSIAAVPRDFDRWLSSHRDLADPWPDFGEFVRATLLACCGASQIKAYRLLSPDDSTLLPMHETSPKEHDFPPLRSGIRGYVATSGKSFYKDNQANDSVHELAGLSDETCAWCFSVQEHDRLIGVIQVGVLADSSIAARHRLQLLEGMVSLCWGALTEACRSRLAVDTDSVAGVLTSEAFLSIAGTALSESYARNEPVAVATFNVEGLRRLTDQGRWEIAQDAIRRISEILRERIREDDRAGFFDGSQFIVMLVRVEPELAGLIVRKIQSHIATMIKSLGNPGDQLNVRCGLAGSGTGQPTLGALVSRASSIASEARSLGVNLLVCTYESSGVIAP
jgi:GGDEF domain-containing protein